VEVQTVRNQIKYLDSIFGKAVSFMKNCKGCGLGKIPFDRQKNFYNLVFCRHFIFSRRGLNSDIDMLIKDDNVIMLSYSDET
jgi:hypothetical protein